MSGVVHPEWLGPALFTLLGAVLVVAFARRRAAARLARLLGGSARLASPGRDVALLVALAAAFVALLGPRAGLRERSVPASGIDVVMLLDVSRSMDAADTPPSRLARARRAADEVLAGLEPEDRAALAAFASRGALLTPLTPDRDALRELLAGLEGDLITPRGSALGAGVRAALAAFEAASERPRVLLVLSDGEDAGRGRDVALDAALRAGVRVVAAAFGSDEGSLIADHGMPLVDAEGATVVTRRTLAPLARLAEATRGELFRAEPDGALDGPALVGALRRDAGRAGGSVVRRESATQVLPFAGLAFALLLLELLPAPSGLASRRRLALAAIPLLLAAGPLGHELARRLHDDGLARFERGDLAGAARSLRAAALATPDESLAALAYYNLGVAHLAAGELEAARGAFFDALALAPEDADARFDLEWTLAALAKRPPPAPPREDPREQREQESEAPRPAAPPQAAAGAGREGTGVSPLSEQERTRLLERVPDDPRRALLANARRRPGDDPARPQGPVW